MPEALRDHGQCSVLVQARTTRCLDKNLLIPVAETVNSKVADGTQIVCWGAFLGLHPNARQSVTRVQRAKDPSQSCFGVVVASDSLAIVRHARCSALNVERSCALPTNAGSRGCQVPGHPYISPGNSAIDHRGRCRFSRLQLMQPAPCTAAHAHSH